MKTQFRTRLFQTALDIDRVAFERKVKKMSDAELLEFLEAPDFARFRLMSDAELEDLITGSLRNQRRISNGKNY